MATMMKSGSTRKYSWWWDSHISPKNSKWLQENLKDMDSKVKVMIKLIEEDADSFARRAEMYYKKRPELMKLVEEFYRAYRALAERYNHATGELRQAQKTMAAAFPNEYSLADDSRSESTVTESEPRTPERIPHQIRTWLDADDLQKEANNIETDLETVKKTLEAEKEAIFILYQKSLEKLSNLERELSNAQKDVGGLDERASNAETEVKVLKEALGKLEGERDSLLLQNNNCLEKISTMVALISQAQEDAKGINERAKSAETEARDLKKELSRLEEEKESGLNQYKQCLEIISALENKVSIADENARRLNEQTNRAESEIKVLKHDVAKLTEEKEEAGSQYKQCLEIIAKMESEIYHAREDAKRLNMEILMGSEKLKSMDEQCIELERSNEFLQIEAGNLARQIAAKDRQLSDKQNELEKLQNSMQDEHSRFLEVETTLQSLHKLHSRSQEEQRALALELQDKFQTLKNHEMRNNELEEENQQLNMSSTISKQNMENEILSLKEMKEKLEEQVFLQVARSNDLQQEVCQLREEIRDMSTRYMDLLEQVKSVGMNPECIHSSVKDLQDKNSKLKEACEVHCTEKEALLEKMRDMDDLIGKNVALEKSVSELNGKLQESKEKIKDLHDSRQYQHGEKSALVEEKTTLLSQLTIMTRNMQNVLEKNSSLENSFKDANIELERLREKSRSLEEFCQLLKSEKSNILDERNFLVSRLQNVEQRLGNLELRFVKLEEKYVNLEKEKYSMLVQVEKLQGSLNVEQQARASHEQSSQSQMADMEKHIYTLREENRSTKKEFDAELDKAIKVQVEIFILQKFIENLEEKNFSLSIECRKHFEASKLSDKLIAELESENLEQQVEAEFLFDEIEKRRVGIYQVFRALHFDPVNDKIGREEIPLPHILDSIEDLKGSVSSNVDEKHRTTIENTVLLTVLGQLGLEGAELESEKTDLDQEFKIMKEHCTTLTEQKHDLFEKNGILNVKMTTMQEAYNEKDEEVNSLSEELNGLHVITTELKTKVASLGEKLETKEAKNLYLNEVVEKLSRELHKARDVNDEKEKEFLEAEEKLRDTQILNAELCMTIGELSRDCRESKQIRENVEKQIVEISENSNKQNLEIERLRQENEKLERRVVELHEEMEQQRVREENLCLELRERGDEFEVWEAKAASFYFDFQASTVHEVLLENKIEEITTICKNLEGSNAAKDETIEEMNGTVGILEGKLGVLKAQLSGYASAIASLKDGITSLEHNTIHRRQFHLEQTSKEMAGQETSCQESGNIGASDMTSDLVEMQTRINAIEKAVVEETDSLAEEGSLKSIVKEEVVSNDPEVWKLRRSALHHGQETLPGSCTPDHLKLLKTRSKGSEARYRIMKDIPLDQVSNSSFSRRTRRKSGGSDDQVIGMLESAEKDYSHGRKINVMHNNIPSRRFNDANPKSQDFSLEFEKELSVDKLEISTSIREQNKGRKKGLVLDRLHSDAKKLTTLQTSVSDMKSKVEVNKRIKKKTNDMEYRRVEWQLEELEDAVLQLIDANEQLTKDIDPSTPVGKTSTELKKTGTNNQGNRVLEQARKGSEKIGRLQFEVQSIQYLLLKLEDENRTKGKSRFSGGILLRDFVYSSRKSIKRRKKSRFCGCVRPNASSNSSSS